MFTQAELFAKALLIEKPWFVDKIEFDQGKGRLDITIDFERGSMFLFEDKSLSINGYFKAYDTTEKTWRHLNFFQYECYLHARIPRIDAGNGVIRQVKAPWEGLSNGFTLLFESFMLELVKLMPVHQVSGLLGVPDQKIWRTTKVYTDIARMKADYSMVKEVGVDETAARRGHDYVSLFVDLEERKTIFITEGRSNETVKRFCEDLEEHKGNPMQVEQVSCDMSPAFIKGIGENFPQAAIVFDRFHVIKVINEAVDRVRKEEVKTNPILRKSKYLFLSNKNNLNEVQKERLDDIRFSKLNIKTVKAYHIKESFQQIYDTKTVDDFEKLLKKWYYWATHSKLGPIIQAAKTIKRHWHGIINWIFKKLNNGILEGFNSLFQAAKAKARGYRRFDTISTIIYLLTGKLDFSSINPYCNTHSK